MTRHVIIHDISQTELRSKRKAFVTVSIYLIHGYAAQSSCDSIWLVKNVYLICGPGSQIIPTGLIPPITLLCVSYLHKRYLLKLETILRKLQNKPSIVDMWVLQPTLLQAHTTTTIYLPCISSIASSSSMQKSGRIILTTTTILTKAHLFEPEEVRVQGTYSVYLFTCTVFMSNYPKSIQVKL